MLAAGAGKVYWLRVYKKHLRKGLAALLKLIESDAWIVCESNSLRQVAEPGCFIVLKKDNSDIFKPSCQSVLKYADRIVTFDGVEYDVSPMRLDRLKQDADYGKWLIREPATAIVLAGGRSRRMKENKSLLPVNDKPMIEFIVKQLENSFSEIIIGTDQPEKFSFLNLKTVADQSSGCGPIMGIYSCLEASVNDFNLVVACDIPLIDMNFISQMLLKAKGYDAVVPVIDGDKYEPLYAVYRKSALQEIANMITAGKFKISYLFDDIKVNFVPMSAHHNFWNLNTREDYRKFLNHMKF